MTSSNDYFIDALVDEMGWDMTLVKKTTGSYTPGTGLSSATQTETTVKALMLEYEEEERDFTNIRQDDRKCVIAAFGLSVEPDSNDLIRDDDGVTYNIIKAKVIRQGDSNIAFICQVRK